MHGPLIHCSSVHLRFERTSELSTCGFFIQMVYKLARGLENHKCTALEEVIPYNLNGKHPKRQFFNKLWVCGVTFTVPQSCRVYQNLLPARFLRRFMSVLTCTFALLKERFRCDLKRLQRPTSGLSGSRPPLCECTLLL